MAPESRSIRSSRALSKIGGIVGSFLVVLGIVALVYANWSGFFDLLQGCPPSLGGPCGSAGAVATAVGQAILGFALIIAGAIVVLVV
jgi:hypothetical protein